MEKSVFAGVKRNSLTFEDITKLHNGEVLKQQVSDRFFKSLTNLNISIKSMEIEVRKTNPKLLYNNFYYPPIINNQEREFSKEQQLLKFGQQINRNLGNRIKRLKFK